MPSRRAACDGWPVALRALLDRMLHGMFTGARLDRFFNAEVDDALHARKNINGSDCAAKIAGYHHLFHHALQLASQPQTKAMALRPSLDKPEPLKAA